MVASLSSLVKTVQSVEDKQAQVERAVAASLEAIDADLSVLSAGERPAGPMQPPAGAPDLARSVVWGARGRQKSEKVTFS